VILKGLSLNINDLMSPQVVVAKEDTNAEKISFRLVAGDINGMPVLDDNGSVVGMVTALDILRAVKGGNKELNRMVAKDIMTPNPSVITQNTPIDEVISIIVQKEIVLVPVVENDDSKKLVGVVARLDILRELLKEKLNAGFITIGKPPAGVG
jgi:CBS domain-containing protein